MSWPSKPLSSCRAAIATVITLLMCGFLPYRGCQILGVIPRGTVVTRSERPARRQLARRRVGAELPGVDRGGEVLAEGRRLAFDRPDRRPDRLGHAHPRPFGRRRGHPVATAQPDRLR